nr:hypothetical protein [Tanacetum cinerariifolium]
RANNDLEANVNRLFNEGGSSAGEEQEARTAAWVRIVSEEDVAPEEPRRLRKKSANAFEAEGSSIIRSAVIPPVVTEAVITTQVASIPSTVAPKSSTKVVTPVHASVFQDSDSAGTVRPDVAGSSHAPGK